MVAYLIDVSFNCQNRNGAFQFCSNQEMYNACKKDINISKKEILVQKHQANRLKVYSCMARIRHDPKHLDLLFRGQMDTYNDMKIWREKKSLPCRARCYIKLKYSNRNYPRQTQSSELINRLLTKQFSKVNSPCNPLSSYPLILPTRTSPLKGLNISKRNETYPKQEQGNLSMICSAQEASGLK